MGFGLLHDFFCFFCIHRYRYKGKSRLDLVVAVQPKKKRVSLLADDVHNRQLWVDHVNALLV